LKMCMWLFGIGAQGLWAGIFIVPHLLWHRVSVLPVSPKRPPHLIVSYNLQGLLQPPRGCQGPIQTWVLTGFTNCLFIAARAIFQLSGGCHHYRWQGCKF
jgi:hypothetical protein